MIPAPFEYIRAGSPEEVLAALAEHGDEAKVLAGGMSLLPLMKLRLAQPGHLVDLARVPGLTLVPLPESDLCCGAAGTYNLTQPEMSTQLAERKLRNIASTGAPLCITGNVGCAMQIQSQADAQGKKLRVVHPVTVLHRALFGS